MFQIFSSKKNLLIAVIMTVYMTGCGVSQYQTKEIRFSSPVFSNLPESDLSNPFSRNHEIPVSSFAPGEVLFGYLVFPRNENGLVGNIFMIVKENKNVTGKWPIMECETNSTVISGTVTVKKDELENEYRYISLKKPKCLKIMVREKVKLESDEDF